MSEMTNNAASEAGGGEAADLILQARGLMKSYGRGEAATPVLRGVDLDVRRGEFLAVMGQSGSGKSTLLHILGLMDRPDGGTLSLDREPIDWGNNSQRTRLCRNSMGFVFQRFNLISTISAKDNLAISLRLRGLPGDKEYILECLERVGVLHVAARKSGQMSIGEQQRVAVARALAHQPALLLADEPTGSLDSTNAEALLELFTLANNAGQTIVMITHSAAAAQVAHRICHMRDGLIQSE